jgi:hypothetical protein
MSQLQSIGGRRKSKATRRPTRTVKHRRQRHGGGRKPSKARSANRRFIRPPTMGREQVSGMLSRNLSLGMPPHVQMDIDNPISAYLADYYMNVDIERLSRKMFSEAVDKIYNTPKSSFSIGGPLRGHSGPSSKPGDDEDDGPSGRLGDDGDDDEDGKRKPTGTIQLPSLDDPATIEPHEVKVALQDTAYEAKLIANLNLIVLLALAEDKFNTEHPDESTGLKIDPTLKSKIEQMASTVYYKYNDIIKDSDTKKETLKNMMSLIFSSHIIKIGSRNETLAEKHGFNRGLHNLITENFTDSDEKQIRNREYDVNVFKLFNKLLMEMFAVNYVNDTLTDKKTPDYLKAKLKEFANDTPEQKLERLTTDSNFKQRFQTYAEKKK